MAVKQFVWIRSYDTNDIKTRIIFACEYSGMRMSTLCSKIGISQSCLSQRLDRGKFEKSELEEIAKAIGCQYYSCFRFVSGIGNNRTVNDISAAAIGQQVKDALEYSGMTIDGLSTKTRLTRQAVSSRMSIGKFTQLDLDTLAKYMGCEYISEFQFDDGVVI